MLNLFLDIDPPTIFNAHNNFQTLTTYIIGALLAGFGILFALLKAPPQTRRGIVFFVTFISGFFYVLLFIWPSPINRSKGDAPINGFDNVGFWLADAQPVVSTMTQIIGGFLIGLGIFSLMRIHLKRIVKGGGDAPFSFTLVLSMILMIIFGFWDFHQRQQPGAGPLLDNQANWGFVNYAKDYLFDGMLQEMEAAMFSIIAFYILSAAYRAFRVRSIEATILLTTALIVILSLMSVVEYQWGEMVNSVAGGNKNSFVQNFTLTNVAGWIRASVQQPSIRGIDFGVGIGLLAMSLRIWLSLERAGE
ncbi:MAG: hypothetical protein JSS72_08455 [Armatimonadetes bacterium]|nr:hypothetical protein [Armatimonadota bacterium]